MLNVVKSDTFQKIAAFLLILAILGFTAAGAYLNVLEEKSKDESKLPQKLEVARGFQRWLTNLKNKEFDIEADEFALIEENEIYNTRWIKISSIEEEGKREEFELKIKEVTDPLESDESIDMVVFSPSLREFVDYRPIVRDGYQPNEVRFYGLRDDKIIDSRIVDCSMRLNCYFDRAFFIDNSNDVFGVSEFSRYITPGIERDDVEITPCTPQEVCTYTIKLHLIDLVNNSRIVYESKPFDIVLEQMIPEL